MEMMTTSGFDFEGYRIVEYYGVCTGECALGTGFLSSLGASLADFLGTDSQMYSGKLKKAKDIALEHLTDRVKEVGGNAIIGLDIDYTSFSADIMGVIANGTAVKIEPAEMMLTKTIQINIINYNPDLNFRPTMLSISSYQNEQAVSLKLAESTSESVDALYADIILKTIFEDEFELGKLGFLNFRSETNANNKISAQSFCTIPHEILPLVNSAKVIIRKYIMNHTIHIATDNDHLWVEKKDHEAAHSAPQMSQGLNPQEYVSSISFLGSATEILNYTKNLNENNENYLNPELLEIISLSAKTERMYGNAKEDCIKKIKNYLNSAVSIS